MKITFDFDTYGYVFTSILAFAAVKGTKWLNANESIHEAVSYYI